MRISPVFKVLLTFHMIGLVMGFVAPFSNMIIGATAKGAAPDQRQALMLLPPRIARISHAGLGLLIITGIWMVFQKFGGFAALPWTFHVKLTAVVVLVVAVGMIDMNMRKAFKQGDAAAMSRIEGLGKLAFLAALTALVFAVVTFGV